MELYGQHSKSIPQKITIHVFEILLLWLSFWILFQDGGDWVANHLHIRNTNENHERRTVIFVFNIVIFLRLAYMMLFLLKRKIPWEESISVPLAFAIYYIGYSLLVLPTSQPIDSIDYFAIALFVAGCFINSGGEIKEINGKDYLRAKEKFTLKDFLNTPGTLITLETFYGLPLMPLLLEIGMRYPFRF